MTKRILRRHGYTIKHTSVGWWVDGASGFMVSGYQPTETMAIAGASAAIKHAKASGDYPVWLFYGKGRLCLAISTPP